MGNKKRAKPQEPSPIDPKQKIEKPKCKCGWKGEAAVVAGAACPKCGKRF